MAGPGGGERDEDLGGVAAGLGWRRWTGASLRLQDRRRRRPWCEPYDAVVWFPAAASRVGAQGNGVGRHWQRPVRAPRGRRLPPREFAGGVHGGGARVAARCAPLLRLRQRDAFRSEERRVGK